VIEREFGNAKGSEAVGFSHGDFGFVVQALHHAAGELLFGLEVIQNQMPMRPQHSGDLLHRLDPGSQGLTTSFIQELTGPGGRVLFPELLEVFFEKVGANGFQVVTEQIP
jgi:hypothetical protein